MDLQVSPKSLLEEFGPAPDRGSWRRLSALSVCLDVREEGRGLGFRGFGVWRLGV